MCKKMFLLVFLISLLGLAGTAAQAEPNVIPTDWPVMAQWHFDEGTGQTVSDASGNGWGGYLGDSNATTDYDPNWWENDDIGIYGLDFEPNDGVRIPLQDGRHPASNAAKLMIDVWIKPETLSDYATVVSAGDSGTDKYAIWLFADGRVRFASAGTPITTPSGTIVAGQWYRIVGVYDDRPGETYGYSELYVDGVKKASWYEHTGSLTTGGNTELTIGWYYPNTTQYAYDGVIDGLTISDDIIIPGLVGRWRLDDNANDAIVVASVGGNGTFNDAGGNYWTSAHHSVDRALGTGALDFDGFDDYVVIPGFDVNSNTVTMSAWIKKDVYQGNWRGIVNKIDGNTKAGILMKGLGWQHRPELRYIWNGINYTWESGLFVPGQEWENSQWVFVALVVNPNQATLYMSADGTMNYATNTVTHNAEDFSQGSIWLDRIPGLSSSSYDPNFTNKMDDVRIYDYALSGNEIRTLAGLDAAIAWDPDPAAEEFISSKDKDSATLSWSAGAYAATHDVYLGTNYNAVKDADTSSSVYKGNQAGNSYDPCSLESSTTYYWRIDEVNDSNSDLWKGDVWSFNVVNMTRQDFGGGAGQTSYTSKTYGSGTDPCVISSELRLVSGTGQRNVIAFDQNDVGGLYGRIVAEWDFNIATGKEGFGFALLNTADYNTSGAESNLDIDWEEPSLTSSFSVGFDIFDPNITGEFSGQEHEVSLHLNGRERANVRSPYDFRSEEFVRARVEVDFVTGGANISVYIDEVPAYTDYFLAGMTPYDCRVAFGGRTNADVSTTAYLDNIEVAFEEPVSAILFPDPNLVQTFVKEHIYGAEDGSIYWMAEADFNFPDEGKDYGRIILRIALDEPEGGSDPTDRTLAVDVWDDPDDDATKYEIARLGTPYGKPGLNWKWWIDVTDYQWLLRGVKKVRISPGFNKGWLVTTNFYFYEGTPEYLAYRGENLWSGTPNYGECGPDSTSGLDCVGQGDPIDDFFTPLDVNIDPNADQTKLRFMVTGHGETYHPEGSAAEFFPRGRTVDVNNGSYYDFDVIWREDCYLNPVRDQRIRNWRYHREGWCPADVVRPWEIDITDDVTPDTNAVIYYDADEYILINDANYNDGVARHKVESQIFYYLQHDLTNNIPNPSFEEDDNDNNTPDGWERIVLPGEDGWYVKRMPGEDAVKGLNYMRIYTGDSNDGESHMLIVESDKFPAKGSQDYEIKVYTRFDLGASGGKTIVLWLDELGEYPGDYDLYLTNHSLILGSSNPTYQHTTNGEWEEKTMSFTSHPLATKFDIRFNITGTVIFDADMMRDHKP